MHVPHHMPQPTDANLRPVPRKPAPGQDHDNAARVAEISEQNRRQGSRRPPQRRGDPQERPAQASVDRRPMLVTRPREPFMVVTSATQFWTQLVMADKDRSEAEGLDRAAPNGAVQQQDASLLDLFAKAVR